MKTVYFWPDFMTYFEEFFGKILRIEVVVSTPCFIYVSQFLNQPVSVGVHVEKVFFFLLYLFPYWRYLGLYLNVRSSRLGDVVQVWSIFVNTFPNLFSFFFCVFSAVKVYVTYISRVDFFHQLHYEVVFFSA